MTRTAKLIRPNIMDKLSLTLQWVQDRKAGGMIEAPGYTRSYLSIKSSVSCDELDLICEIVNKVLEASGAHHRITWSMGEIIPAGVWK